MVGLDIDKTVDDSAGMSMNVSVTRQHGNWLTRAGSCIADTHKLRQKVVCGSFALFLLFLLLEQLLLDCLFNLIKKNGHLYRTLFILNLLILGVVSAEVASLEPAVACDVHCAELFKLSLIEHDIKGIVLVALFGYSLTRNSIETVHCLA